MTASPEPFKTLSSRPLVLDLPNIDTDQIIPARFLTTTERAGLGKAAFADWRYDDAGETKPDSPFTREDIGALSILVAGDNFGCGSSREHAPWALTDFGFKVVLSTSFADIFRGNALKNGLLAIEIDEATFEAIKAAPEAEITVDLEAETLTAPGVGEKAFKIDGFARRCLLDGVDQLGFILARSDAIDAFEAGRDA